MRRTLPFLLVFVLLQLTSCVSNQQIITHASQAKEPNMSCFVVTQKGDTIEGSTLETKRGKLVLNGKSYSTDEISAYQNKVGFFYDGKLRVANGKLQVYVLQQDNSHMDTRYVSSTKSSTTEMHGGSTTIYFIRKGTDQLNLATERVLRRYFADCPSGLKQLESVIGKTITKWHREWTLIHYNKLIAAVKAYNNAPDCK
jgi:hypothetical protein